MEYLTSEFIEITPDEIFIGTNKGSLYYAAERPRHKVEIKYKFAITKFCISELEWENVFKKTNNIPNFNQFNQKELMEFIRLLNEENEDYQFRLPSEAEWELAKNKLKQHSQTPNKNGELIADQPHVSYWGAPCNGSPWLEENIKNAGFGMQMCKLPHFFSNEKHTQGISRHKNHKKNIRFRIVRLTKSHKDSYEKQLPLEFDRFEIFKRELIFALVIGIIPSFIWAGINSPGYIFSGMGNLIMGGVFFSLVTALVWRPKHSTLLYSDNKIIAISPYKNKIKTLISFEDELL
jgi:hypothetical protein